MQINVSFKHKYYLYKKDINRWLKFIISCAILDKNLELSNSLEDCLCERLHEIDTSILKDLLKTFWNRGISFSIVDTILEKRRDLYSILYKLFTSKPNNGIVIVGKLIRKLGLNIVKFARYIPSYELTPLTDRQLLYIIKIAEQSSLVENVLTILLKRGCVKEALETILERAKTNIRLFDNLPTLYKISEYLSTISLQYHKQIEEILTQTITDALPSNLLVVLYGWNRAINLIKE